MTPEQVKEARQKLGFTQRELAEALGLSKEGRRTVRRWEKGETRVCNRTVLALEQLLDAQASSAAGRWPSVRAADGNDR